MKWPRLLGGGEEVLGPFETAAERDRAVRGCRDPYPGDQWPSVELTRTEVPL